MLYSKHIDYLMASVIYLATQRGWWARTPTKLAEELSLDRDKLVAVFDGFPGIFRKSTRPSVPGGEYYYSLQARYAQREAYGQREEVTDISPLPTDKIRLIYEYIQKSADDERTGWRATLGFSIAIAAALVSATAAIYAASMKTPVTTEQSATIERSVTPKSLP